MSVRSQRPFLAAFALLLFGILSLAAPAYPQSGGNSTSVTATVTDATGAVVPGATAVLRNPVSGFNRTVISDNAGQFTVPNVPFNNYHLIVTRDGFNQLAQDVDVRSNVPVTLTLLLQVKSTTETVNVEASSEDLLETTASFHTDVDRELIEKLPLESQSSSLSSLVTLSTPGVAADSNGLFHGLGDHAQNSFSVDDQPITDQQSKSFSNQIPLDSIESLEVISGAPPAEYGEKTSLVINVTTRSGQGLTTPKGSVKLSYGSFGSANLGFNLGFGGKKWGNFVSLSGFNTSRFLDPPEFKAFHDRGNEENAFDRIDWQPNAKDSIRLNLGFTRSWFQTPNTYDNLHPTLTDPLGSLTGQTDQRSQIQTYNLAPTWTHLINNQTIFSLGGFYRHDQYNYYPSNNLFADLGPLQQESITQSRGLNNAGIRSSLSYSKGIHNAKFGITYQQTRLREADLLGIVSPLVNAPCLDATGTPVAGFTDPSQCAAEGLQSNTAANPLATAPFLPFLSCYDLTRPSPAASSNCVGPSTQYGFNGRTNIKLLSLYGQDTVTKGPWSVSFGLRGDVYRGLASHSEVQPRLGVSYNIKKTSTVLRVSYARALETPFNENLILSATGCNFNVIAALVPCVPANFSPGWRNEFHAGLEQAWGKYLVFSGEYIWKYTHNAYDFSVLANTPISFPIAWKSSKIPGFAGRISVPNYKGISGQFVFSSVSARFFPPQIGGLGTTVGQSGLPFRIDHDEKFNQTTHIQYQVPKNGPWIGFNWRYDSGSVAGAVPFALDSTTPVDLTRYTGDQQLQVGLSCAGALPTLTAPLTSCAPADLRASRAVIPAPGTQNPDHNPARIAPRNLFDFAIGHDNLFRTDKRKISAQFTVINLTNKDTLYNFLSTFSGTHFVSPRTYTGEIAFNF